MNVHSLSTYHYELPQELIAQYPIEPRDHSRLMIVDRQNGAISEMQFHELPSLLQKGDNLVFNNTKVIPARLFGKRVTGGSVEVFLSKLVEGNTWEAMVRPGKKLKIGDKVTFSDCFSCKIVDILDNGLRLVSFVYQGSFEDQLNKHGHMPLPQYIKRSDEEMDVGRYQTVFAAKPGAVAAPTAGLHFTQNLLDRCHVKGVYQTKVTLHVGLGTFRPVQTDDIREHHMHKERFIIDQTAAYELNNRNDSERQIVVGTTCCRALESAFSNGQIRAGDHETEIFMYPGYDFKYVKSLLTNFHLPGSTLLMLVTAFGGYELIMEAYSKAVENKFRFFSYGDAMLIL